MRPPEGGFSKFVKGFGMETAATQTYIIHDRSNRVFAMTAPKFVAFSGSWGQPSKTRTLVTEAAAQAVTRYGGSAHVFDIADLGEDFGTTRSDAALSATARGHVDRLLAADALILASPVYKGSYAGLFKHLFDLIDPAALQGKPILLGAAGGGDRHMLVLEHQLRPLFAFFEAEVLATGVYASPQDFTENRLTGAGVLQRLDRAIGQFSRHIAPLSPRFGLAAAE